MTKHKLELDYDDSRGKAAFDRLLPALRDLAPQAIDRLTLDLRRAAIATMALDRVVKRPQVRARFARLPADVFETKHLGALLDLAHAALYIRNNRLEARAQASEARVPVALVAEATETKERMMRIAEYYFADDPVLGVEVQSIRAGSGYLDLASDLTRLALLFARNADVVASDTKWYRADDVQTGRRLANAIEDELATNDANEWSDLEPRVFTLLKRAYDEVRATGHYLFRHEADGDGFPALHAVARPPRSTQRRAHAETITPDASPATPVAATADQ